MFTYVSKSNFTTRGIRNYWFYINNVFCHYELGFGRTGYIWLLELTGRDLD